MTNKNGLVDKTTSDCISAEERGMYNDETGYPAFVCVLRILEEKGMSQSDLARKMGQRIQTVIQKLRRKNPSVDKMIEMLDALGYEMVVLPKDREDNKEGYRIRSV